MLTTQQSCPGTWPKKVCISEQLRLYFIVFLCRCTVESMMPMAYPWPFTRIWRQSVASLKCYRFDLSFPFPRCGPICVSSRRRAERAPCASLRIAGKMQDGLWWIMMDPQHKHETTTTQKHSFILHLFSRRQNLSKCLGMDNARAQVAQDDAAERRRQRRRDGVTLFSCHFLDSGNIIDWYFFH